MLKRLELKSRLNSIFVSLVSSKENIFRKDAMKLKMLFIGCILLQTVTLSSKTWECQILPPEHRTEVDAQSGAEIIFVTTHPAHDRNLYFHDRCFFQDNRMMLFISDRYGRAEIMAYLLETGELVRLNRPQDAPAGHPLASIAGDKLYVMRQDSVLQWQVSISTTPQTRVRIAETPLTVLPEAAVQVSGLAENSDASLLAFAYQKTGFHFIDVLDLASGTVRNAAKLDYAMNHLQFHWTRPDLLSFSRTYKNDRAPLDADEPPHARFWFLNVNTHVPVPAFYQDPGELATHECWWLDDQITFIGGHNSDANKEDGHVKVYDLKTGEIRIIGAGAWWQEGTAAQVAKVNWWHAAGSPDGRWVAADNWHGIIALFDAKTTAKKILTTGHRIYGQGAHLHVGWDLKGERVEFTSNKMGNPDVCIGVIPKEW